MDCLDITPYTGEHNMNDKEQLQFLLDTFQKEALYKYNLIRLGSIDKCFQDWLAGLPSIFNIDFNNYDIWKKAVELELLPANPTDKQIDAFLPKWFHTIQFRTFVLMRKHGINTHNLECK